MYISYMKLSLKNGNHRQKVTTCDKASGMWDAATSQDTVEFVVNTVEIAIWLKTPEGHHSITIMKTHGFT